MSYREMVEHEVSAQLDAITTEIATWQNGHEFEVRGGHIVVTGAGRISLRAVIAERENGR